jgi:hypothetical protein
VVLALDPFLRDIPFISKEALLFRELMKALEEDERRRVKAKPGKGELEEEEVRKALASRKIVL